MTKMGSRGWKLNGMPEVALVRARSAIQNGVSFILILKWIQSLIKPRHQLTPTIYI